MSKDLIVPPTEGIKDAAYDVTKAALGSLPWFGRSAEGVFDQLVRSPLEKKAQRWREEVAIRILTLEAQGYINIEDLAQNEDIAATISAISLAAMRTTDQEKLKLLQNAAINADLILKIVDGYKDIILMHIERLTAWHIRFLRILNNPSSVNAIDPKRDPITVHNAVSMEKLLTTAHPDLANDRRFLVKIHGDLVREGLLIEEDLERGLYLPYAPPGMRTESYEKFTTEWGEMVIEFFLEPETRHSKKE